MPKSWSTRKLALKFETTRYMASVAKKIAEEKGVLADPNPKGGKTLTLDAVNNIKAFYLSEHVSRIMPGKKDYCTVIDSQGKRNHLQKPLFLFNSKQAYQMFKERNPLTKVRSSKPAHLRTKNSVLAGTSGPH